MKDKITELMSDLNDIIVDMDDTITVLELQIDGIVEGYDSEMARSVLRVHLFLLKRSLEHCNELYSKLDETFLSMKEYRWFKREKGLKKWKFWRGLKASED